MALKYHYAGLAASGISAFDLEVTQVRLGELGLVTEAELGATGVCGVWVDDPGATQDFVADKGWYVLDDACPAGATLTGTLAKAAASATIAGTSTLFTSELTVGREIAIPGGGGTDYLIVSAIASNTSLTVYDAPTRTATGQTATVAANQRMWTGYIGDQKISRGAGRSGGGEPMGNGRDWSLDLADLNSALHFRIITGPKDAAHGDRPAETVGVRLAWLLTAAEVSGLIYDEGLVQYPTNALDAADLRGRFVDEILNEWAQVTGYNPGLYFHEATGHTCLYFDLDTSTRHSSPLRLSNDRADISAGNAGPVWATWPDAELTRSGRRVISGAYGPYSGGAEYRTLASTAANFAARDGNAPNTNIKTAATMDAYLDRYLADNATQELRLKLTYTVPAAHLNDALPFQRIQVKQTHMPNLSNFPNLGTWNWCRILRRQLKQHMADNGQPVPGQYDVSLELSPTLEPQAFASCAYVAPSGGSATPLDVLGGALSSSWFYNTAASLYPSTVSGANFSSYGTANNGSPWGVTAGVSSSAVTVHWRWVWDLLAAGSPRVCMVGVRTHIAEFGDCSIAASNDGTNWTTIITAAALAAAAVGGGGGAGNPAIVSIPYASSLYRYWSLFYTFDTPAGVAYFIGFDVDGVLFWGGT